MRLLSPNPGECADRQTILELKIRYGSLAEPVHSTNTIAAKDRVVTRTTVENISWVNVQPFIDENEIIQQYLEKHWFPDAPAVEKDFNCLFEELGKINEEVWKLTDLAHTLTEAPDRMQITATLRAAETLFSITELNDKRARVVSRINSLFDIKYQEKIFA